MFSIHTHEDEHDEAGFTLIELVVAMVLFSLFTLAVFNLLDTSSKTQHYVSSTVEHSIDFSRAFEAMGKDVRLAPEARVNESGDSLYLMTQDNEVIVWRIGASGLTNGSRTFADFEEAHFEVDAQGVVTTSLTTADGSAEGATFSPRFSLPSEPTLTDSVLAAH